MPRYGRVKTLKIASVVSTASNSYRSSNNSAKWIPGSLIKPVEKVIESMFDHVMSGAVVEP